MALLVVALAAARCAGPLTAARQHDRRTIAAAALDRAPAGRGVDLLGLYGTIGVPTAGTEGPLDGIGGMHQVTFASHGSDFDPELDSTGRLLVYASTQHRKNADIYLKNVDGTAVTQLTDDPARDEMPTFSPDGQRIAFASNRSGNWDIQIVDVGAGPPVQVTSGLTDEIHPAFSPDGRQLVYCAYGPRSGQWEMVVIELANPARKQFIGFGLFPQWSPDGKKILFQRAREWGTRWFSIWTVEMVDGQPARPIEIVACANAAAITPTWGPKGQHIVFCTVVHEVESEPPRKPDRAELWMVRADGRQRVNLTSDPYANLQPTWGGDGTIAYVSNRIDDRRESIWAIRPHAALRLAASLAAVPNGTAAGWQPAAAITPGVDQLQ